MPSPYQIQYESISLSHEDATSEKPRLTAGGNCWPLGTRPDFCRKLLLDELTLQNAAISVPASVSVSARLIDLKLDATDASCFLNFLVQSVMAVKAIILTIRDNAQISREPLTALHPISSPPFELALQGAYRLYFNSGSKAVKSIQEFFGVIKRLALIQYPAECFVVR